MKKETKTPSKARTIQISSISEKDKDMRTAELYLAGPLNSTNIILTYNANAQMDATETLSTIERKVSRSVNGDTKDTETLLISQAVALDAIFTNLCLRAHRNFGHYIDAGEKYLRLALKAQSQCRATLETLAEIKNPRPYIQNNRAEYQQVNNGAIRNSDRNTRTPAHTEKTFSTNELLEDKTHEQEWLDTRTPRETIRSD